MGLCHFTTPYFLMFILKSLIQEIKVLIKQLFALKSESTLEHQILLFQNAHFLYPLLLFQAALLS